MSGPNIATGSPTPIVIVEVPGVTSNWLSQLLSEPGPHDNPVVLATMKPCRPLVPALTRTGLAPAGSDSAYPDAPPRFWMVSFPDTYELMLVVNPHHVLASVETVALVS
jgi:hypothetical protein